MTMQSAIRGLCKVTNLPLPKLREIEESAKDCFYYIDVDYNKKIDF